MKVECIYMPENIKELRNKAERYCSQAERCRQEVEQKLAAWGAEDADRETVVAYLYDNGWLDDRRYCRAFVHDKVSFARWGRQKIRYALRAKGLPDREIECALAEIDQTEYINNLQRLIASRPAADSAEEKSRLFRFLLQKGYTWNEISETTTGLQ